MAYFCRVTPNQETTAKGRRAMIGKRNAGWKVQWGGIWLIELPMVIAIKAGAQTNQPVSDKKELL